MQNAEVITVWSHYNHMHCHSNTLAPHGAHFAHAENKRSRNGVLFERNGVSDSSQIQRSRVCMEIVLRFYGHLKHATALQRYFGVLRLLYRVLNIWLRSSYTEFSPWQLEMTWYWWRKSNYILPIMIVVWKGVKLLLAYIMQIQQLTTRTMSHMPAPPPP